MKNKTYGIGIASFSFVLGAILMLNISGVGAVAPSVNPPYGNVDATFNSVHTNQLQVEEDISARTVHFEHVYSTLSGPVSFPRGIYNGTIPVSEPLTIYDDLIVDGNITVTEGHAIGRFITHMTGTSNDNPVNELSVGETTSSTAICPENTYISGCTGQLIDSSANDDMLFLGSIAAASENSCTSYVTRSKEGTSAWDLASQVICFDPTIAAELGTGDGDGTGDDGTGVGTGVSDDAAARQILEEMQAMRDEMADLNNEINRIDGAMDPMQTSLTTLEARTMANHNAVSDVSENVDKMTSSVDNLNSSMGQVGTSLLNVQTGMQLFDSTFTQLGSKLSSFSYSTGTFDGISIPTLVK
jgi:prefoldin subunit 5